MGLHWITNDSQNFIRHNNADFGISLQKLICEHYKLEINEYAKGQFNANYSSEFDSELKPLCTRIFKDIGYKPIEFLTFTRELISNKQTVSPHNFLLENGKTLSVRTLKTRDKIAPRTIGQAGYSVLNDYFADIYGKEITSQEDIRKMVFFHIHELLPIFIDNMFQSDYTVFVNRSDLNNITIIKNEDLGMFSFTRDEFTFTRGLDLWTESTTLKYHGISIAEIQTHKERTFKFRFIVTAIPVWFKKTKETTETLGISAEAAICKHFNIKQPDSFATRCSSSLMGKLAPVVKNAFQFLPPAIQHTGSESGERGKQSKCSYDFMLKGNKTLSLKTNKGKMVCPPEVGQPGADTCLLYFKEFFPKGLTKVTDTAFKEMVFEHIADIIPIYFEHMFDSDWLLWIYQVKEQFVYKAISKDDIKEFNWEADKFSFTKPNIEVWNESNTLKYNGLTIGEFQVHKHRSCFKFRFHLENLLNLIQKQK